MIIPIVFSLKGKINAPPKDPDEQPIPKSFTRLFAFQEKDKAKVVSKARNGLKHSLHTKGNKYLVWHV